MPALSSGGSRAASPVAVDPLAFVRSDFRDLEAYTPVQPLDVLATEIGIPVDQIAKLDANENLYGPHPDIREAVANADLHIYPDPGQGALRAAIGEYLAVDPDRVVAGAGSDDLLDILVRLTEPRAIVNATPTFGMYSFLGKLAKARIVEVPRDPANGFTVDVDGIARAVADGATLVFLASPNNPTGTALPESDIEAICALNALVVVDEAYAEFMGRSAVAAVDRFPNLVVLRTFSKWAALAGLRVGYAVADEGLASRMMQIKQPYNVNVAADVAARVALERRAEIMETVRCLVEERDRMVSALGRFKWLLPVPSEANFVLFEVVGRPAAEVAAGLRKRGVLVRYYDRADLANYIRISAGRPEDTDRLTAALAELEAE